MPKERVMFLYVPKMTKVTLIGAHKMLPVSSNFEHLFSPPKSLIAFLIILRSPDQKGAAHWHVVTVSAPHPPTWTLVSLSGQAVAAEHVLGGGCWFCATCTPSSQLLPATGSLVVSKAYDRITADRQRLVRACAKHFPIC